MHVCMTWGIQPTCKQFMVGYPKMAICDGESGWKWWSTPNFFGGTLCLDNTFWLNMENTSDVPKPLKNRLVAFRHPIHSDANIWVPIRARMIMLYIFIYTIYIYIYIHVYTLSIPSQSSVKSQSSVVTNPMMKKSSSYTPLPLSVITSCLFVVCVYIYIYIYHNIYIYIDIID